MLQLNPIEQLRLIGQDIVLKIKTTTANSRTMLSIVQVKNQIITTETHINHQLGNKD